MRVRHIEMYDGEPFCERSYDYDGVGQRDWHADPAKIGEGTCLRCLRRIATMGDVADLTLRAVERAGHTDERQATEIAKAEEERQRRVALNPGGTLTLEGFNALLTEVYDKAAR